MAVDELVVGAPDQAAKEESKKMLGVVLLLPPGTSLPTSLPPESCTRGPLAWRLAGRFP